MNVKKVFNKHDKEYGKFERVENKLSTRSDLHAFLLLEKILPRDEQSIIAGADHDIIYLGVDAENLANVDEAIIIELIRSGVCLDENGLYMNV